MDVNRDVGDLETRLIQAFLVVRGPKFTILGSVPEARINSQSPGCPTQGGKLDGHKRHKKEKEPIK